MVYKITLYPHYTYFWLGTPTLLVLRYLEDIMLTGQAKLDYQREYMRRRRSNKRTKTSGPYVRPSVLDPVRPKYVRPTVRPTVMPVEPIRPDTLEQPSELKQVDSFASDGAVIEPQSYNPMMVGYVPPK